MKRINEEISPTLAKTIEENLKEQATKLVPGARVNYYYLDKDKKVTVAIITTKEGVRLGRLESRGVSICSDKDQVNKVVGRALALGRAVKVLKLGLKDLEAADLEAEEKIPNFNLSSIFHNFEGYKNWKYFKYQVKLRISNKTYLRVQEKLGFIYSTKAYFRDNSYIDKEVNLINKLYPEIANKTMDEK